MKCKEFKKLLAGYLYGDISAGQRKAFQEHAEECPVCRNLRAELEETVSLLRESSPPVLTEAELLMIRAGVRKEIGRGRTESSAVSRRGFIHLILQPRFAAVAAAILFIFLAGVIVLFHSPSSPDAIPAGEAAAVLSLTEKIEEELQVVTEICREIDTLQSLFPEKPKSGSEVGVSINGKIV